MEKDAVFREEGDGARRWRLWQVESAFSCNLQCVMCPWKNAREQLAESGLMSESIWKALALYLDEVTEIDFSGGGEPLLQPRLAHWIRQAKRSGCKAGFLTNGTLLDEAICAELMTADVDWIGFSADGAEAATYERIRRGASFRSFCANLKRLTSIRTGDRPRVMINFVMMPINVGEMQAMVRLAADLGVDQVNFKQCDVIRGNEERELGLFAEDANEEIRGLQANLDEARKLARKLGVETTAFSFTPEELPVCDQDPRSSVFIRHDGRVSPCINLAVGGPTCFLGREVVMPEVHYGKLPDDDLMTLWKSKACHSYRDRFEERVRSHDDALSLVGLESSWIKFDGALDDAREAMAEAPRGCRDCHYLFDI